MEHEIQTANLGATKIFHGALLLAALSLGAGERDGTRGVSSSRIRRRHHV